MTVDSAVEKVVWGQVLFQALLALSTNRRSTDCTLISLLMRCMIDLAWQAQSSAGGGSPLIQHSTRWQLESLHFNSSNDYYSTQRFPQTFKFLNLQDGRGYSNGIHIFSKCIALSKVRDNFLLYFIKYSPYWKMFQIQVTDLKKVSVLCKIWILCSVSCYWRK